MLDPVSTRTVFSWPRTAVGSNNIHPRKTAGSLDDLVRTRSSQSAGSFIHVPRATNINFRAYTTRLAEGTENAKEGESTGVRNPVLSVLRNCNFGGSFPVSSLYCKNVSGAPSRMRTILLLTISNIFMTFAWYGHLKFCR